MSNDKPTPRYSDNPAFGLPHETNNVTDEREPVGTRVEAPKAEAAKKTTPAKKTAESGRK